MSYITETWGPIRSILEVHFSFGVIKEIIGLAGFDLARVLGVPWGFESSETQLMSAIDANLGQFNIEREKRFFQVIAQEIARRQPDLLDPLQEALHRLGWSFSENTLLPTNFTDQLQMQPELPHEAPSPPIEEATAPAIKALSYTERRGRQEWLAEVARLHSSSFVRRSAIVALRDIKSPLVRPISLLLIAHEGDNENLRETAIKCLGDVGTAADLALLGELKENEQIARFGKQAAAKAYLRLSKRLDSQSMISDEGRGTNHPYFDVALSFAGEDRGIAQSLATGLRAKSLRVFYDMFYQSDLVGEDLSRLLAMIYSQASRFCAVLISKHYPQKSWPKKELAHVQERVIFGDDAYLIPVRLDSTTVDGISSTVGHIDLREHSIDQAVEMIADKIIKDRSGRSLSQLLA